MKMILRLTTVVTLFALFSMMKIRGQQFLDIGWMEIPPPPNGTNAATVKAWLEWRNTYYDAPSPVPVNYSFYYLPAFFTKKEYLGTGAQKCKEKVWQVGATPILYRRVNLLVTRTGFTNQHTVIIVESIPDLSKASVLSAWTTNAIINVFDNPGDAPVIVPVLNPLLANTFFRARTTQWNGPKMQLF